MSAGDSVWLATVSAGDSVLLATVFAGECLAGDSVWLATVSACDRRLHFLVTVFGWLLCLLVTVFGWQLCLLVAVLVITGKRSASLVACSGCRTQVGWCQYLAGNSTEDSASLEIVLANTSSVSVFRLVAVFLLRPCMFIWQQCLASQVHGSSSLPGDCLAAYCSDVWLVRSLIWRIAQI